MDFEYFIVDSDFVDEGIPLLHHHVCQAEKGGRVESEIESLMLNDNYHCDLYLYLLYVFFGA